MKNKLARNIIIVVIVLLVIVLARTIYNGLSEKKYRPLPDLESASEKLNSYDIKNYKDFYSIMMDTENAEKNENALQEFVLSNSSGYLGTDLVNIKIFSDQTGEMIRKFRDSDLANDGEIKYNERIALSAEQTTEITKLIEDNEFWSIPTYHPDEKSGFDGNTIFIEGVNGNKYNVISMWCPDDTYEIYKIYKGVIDCAEKWGLNADYFYLSYGIPKEHFNQDMY